MKRVSLVFLTACIFGQKVHVPSAYEGATPLTVVNAGHLGLCDFHLWTATFDDENWFGSRANMVEIPAGQSYTFSIKPGAYHVQAGWCMERTLHYITGTATDKTITIDAPMTMVLGDQHIPHHGGGKIVHYTKIQNLFPEPGQYPEAPAAEEPAEACGARGAQVDSPNDCCDMGRAHQGTRDNGTQAGMPYYCD